MCGFFCRVLSCGVQMGPDGKGQRASRDARRKASGNGSWHGSASVKRTTIFCLFVEIEFFISMLFVPVLLNLSSHVTMLETDTVFRISRWPLCSDHNRRLRSGRREVCVTLSYVNVWYRSTLCSLWPSTCGHFFRRHEAGGVFFFSCNSNDQA